MTDKNKPDRRVLKLAEKIYANRPHLHPQATVALAQRFFDSIDKGEKVPDPLDAMSDSIRASLITLPEGLVKEIEALRKSFSGGDPR